MKCQIVARPFRNGRTIQKYDLFVVTEDGKEYKLPCCREVKVTSALNACVCMDVNFLVDGNRVKIAGEP